MKQAKAIFNWSGGKDSALALHYIRQHNQFDPACLLTSVSAQYKRISMHGVREELLRAQAEAIGIPLEIIEIPESAGMKDYDKLMGTKLRELKTEGYTHSIFGDIYLEDLRSYREQRLSEIPMKAVFPLWKRDTKELVAEFIRLGFKTMVVAADASKLDKSFVGRVIDNDFINDLPAGVDPCGENGEFHTFVFDGPVFKNALAIEKGETVLKEYKSAGNWSSRFWYIDIHKKQD
jgi:uncharacterized protein (TIGR00290 family)